VSSGCCVTFDEDHHGGVYAVLIWCLGSFFFVFVFVLVVAGVGGR
jgi:hypothetical protein